MTWRNTLTRSVSEGGRFTQLGIHRLMERSPSLALRVSVLR